ncbi:MAG TPA: hypothetical protein VEW74_03545, partial [Candidatus Nitrosotalea sp.]|nr:hypothetical protein [Candidatus Nitrosotalea sp.]
MQKRVFRAIVAGGLAAFAAVCTRAALVEATFALQGGVARTSAHLEARPIEEPLSAWTFDFWLTQAGKQNPITAYDPDMTRTMHVIAIGDDFTTFVHEHPAYSPSGHFTMTQTFQKAGTYYLFFDSRPSGFGQQVFRFKIDAGPRAAAMRDLSERSRIAHVDGYAVEISSLTLSAGSETSLALHITKNGKPAADLHPYLEALAHVIAIDADDLSYIHVHPVALVGSASAASQVMVYSSHT